jgi:hypothetical protein
MAIFIIIIISLLFAVFVKKHSHYKIDENGKTYCPAMRDYQEIKRRKKEARITGIDSLQSSPGTGVAEEIKQLASLKEQGLLTEEEFIKQKQKILEG